MPAERGSWPINSDGEVRRLWRVKIRRIESFLRRGVRLCALTARGFQQGIGYLHKPLDTGRKTAGILGKKVISIDLIKSTWQRNYNSKRMKKNKKKLHDTIF